RLIAGTGSTGRGVIETTAIPRQESCNTNHGRTETTQWPSTISKGPAAQSPTPTTTTQGLTGDSPANLGVTEHPQSDSSPMGGQVIPNMHMPPPGMTGGGASQMMMGHWNGAPTTHGIHQQSHQQNGYHHLPPNMQPHLHPYIAAQLTHHYHQQQHQQQQQYL
ncbi:hypothetical protein PRIPAC_71832, partial [Pristionchus pacificus]|uniref:Uncharacterized protein n=1 Tax=Pristionchus pacificus TaxID=54126 RepID=A0A2A6CZI3_PRIPA